MVAWRPYPLEDAVSAQTLGTEGVVRLSPDWQSTAMTSQGSGCQSLDIAAYSCRVGHSIVSVSDLTTLTGLHQAHASTIPFENLDIQMRRPVRLDLGSLQTKLIHNQRGGYCFEQNTLFLAVLQHLGFEVIPHLARVRQGSSALRPRTHMVLVVRVSGAAYLCDVGFGGDGPLQPVPMTGTESWQGHDTFRVVTDGSIPILQLKRTDEWTDLYAVDREEAHPVDFECGNWFTSTHPQSPFVTHVIVQHRTADARYMLRDLTYVKRTGAVEKKRTIERRELVPLLRDVFGIHLEHDVTLRALDAPDRLL